MNELSLIAENIRYLEELSKKEKIFLDDLPIKFKPDLQSYIIGETLSMLDGRLFVGKNLYKKWLLKIRTRGFDYEIDFKNDYC